MEEYPASYVARPRPLIFLSGFAAGNSIEEPDNERPFKHGPRISSKSPLVASDTADRLMHELLTFDPGNLPVGTNLKPMHFRVKTIGREYELPCRKSSPSAQNPGSPVAPSNLHSALSPYSPSSPLFPDGLMHLLWPLKWQELVPALWVSVFTLSAESSEEPPNDELLKTEILAIKNALNEPYRSRCSVILIGDTSASQASNIEDRVANLRKSTKLDARTGMFYLRSDVTQEDLTNFASTVLTALRVVVQEFYRDLSKHSRRKKDRGGHPPPSPGAESPIAQAIPRAGWTARYEYKLGIFAEFRFELDLASRHFYAALDALFDSDGVFENVSSWSPRWNEARLFADSIAIRQVRCLIANGLAVAASRFWIKYRDTTRYILNRRGKGTASYGWKSWEARWAKIMGELVQASAGLAVDLNVRKTLAGIASDGKQSFVQPGENQPAEEPFDPWELLHHAGYWFAYSAELSTIRRSLAIAMPEEDRVPPGQSPATRVARRHETYDTYLCPEPHLESPLSDEEGFDHSHIIVQALRIALPEFVNRSQTRMANFLELRLAKELELARLAQESFDVVKPLWSAQRWRKSEWLGPTRDVALTLQRMAGTADEKVERVMAIWELLALQRVDGIDYSLLEQELTESAAASESTERQMVHLQDRATKSFVDVFFNFGPGESHASEPLRAQVMLRSTLQARSQPLTPTQIEIKLEGNMQGIIIKHDGISRPPPQAAGQRLQTVELTEASDGTQLYMGTADLTLYPDMQQILNLSMVPREAGTLKALTATTLLRTGSLTLSYVNNLSGDIGVADWWVGSPEKPRKLSAIRSPNEIVIHPKLPKVQTEFTNLRDIYYTGELITIEMLVKNGEANAVDITVDVRVPGQDDVPVKVRLASEDRNKDEEDDTSLVNNTGSVLELQMLPASAECWVVVQIQPQSSKDKLTLQAKATYELESPLTTTSSTDIKIVDPFKAQYSINPDLYTGIWPSFFNIGNDDDNSVDLAPSCLTNRWAFHVNLESRADEKLQIKRVEVHLDNIGDGARCNIMETPELSKAVTITSKSPYETVFYLETSRKELEDLRTTHVDASISVHWSRFTQNDIIITTLPTPRLTFPSSEPRVLATSTFADDSDYIYVDLVLENPSTHFLSFNISLEPGESFVFSGPKSINKHLTPISRDTVRYTILPLERETFLRPIFKVVDVHFNKSLHVNPTGAIRSDQGGLLIWSGPGQQPLMPAK